MFEDKRFNDKDKDNNNNIHGPKRFFTSEDNLGLNDGSDNLNFKPEQTFVPEPTPINLRPKPKKDYKGVKVALLVIVVVIFIVGVGIGVMNLFSSPLKVVKKYMEEGYVLVSDYLKELDSKQLNYDINKDTLANSGDLRINSNIPLVEEFNDFTYAYKLNMDVANKEVDGNITIKGNNTDILDSDIYIRDNKVLYDDSRIYSKVLEIGDIEDDLFNSFNSSIDYNDIINLLKCSKDYMVDNMDKKNSAKDKTTIMVNGESLKVKSFSYTYREEELKSLVEGLIGAIINDNNAIESLSDILGYSKKDLESMLEDIEVGSFEEELRLVVYTSGMANMFRGFSVFYGNDEVLSFRMFDGVKEFDARYSSFKVNVLMKSDKTELKVLSDDDEVIGATITKDEDVTSINYQSDYQGLKLEGMLDLELKRVGDKRQTLNITNTLSLSMGNEDYELEFEISNMSQVGTKITSLNNKEIVKYEDLEIGEQRIVENNLYNTLKLTPFYDLIDSVMGTIENKAKCSLATDCVCDDEECSCTYLDENNVLQNIICPG